MRGLQLPKGVTLENEDITLEKKHSSQKGIVRVLIPLWASYAASANQLRINPQAKTLPTRIATLIHDIRLKVFYDDGTEDSRLLGAMHEALSMLIPAAMVRVGMVRVGKAAKMPTLRLGKLTIAQAKGCAQAVRLFHIICWRSDAYGSEHL